MGQGTTTPLWKLQLAASPRLIGEVPLSAYDCSLKNLVIDQYLLFDGLLPCEALEAGLSRALQQFPIFLGRIQPHLPHRGTSQLCWDSHDIDNPGMAWETAVNTGQPPNIWSTWSVWKRGLAPAVTGRLAAAKVTLFPAANKSLMVFAFDHAVCDYPTAYNFMYLWFEEAAAAAACLAPGSAVNTDGLKMPPVDALVSIGSATEDAQAAKPLLHSSSMPGRSSSLGGGLGAAAGSLEAFSRHWYQECDHWQLPSTRDTSTGSSSGKTQQQDQLRAEAQQWLHRHSGANCPFPWDPLSPADACRQAWQLVVDGMTYTYSVWRIPRSLIEEWKAAAAAACPLPEGNWYSSNNAATAMLAATLYKASPAKARAQGGLHVAAVVDLRGNRCGLTIPRDSATNPSVWGIRTWVPDSALAAADGWPTPELMHYLREGLNKQLKDPQGSINKMFEYWEAVRRAGRCHEAQLCQGLQQMNEDDLCVDWLPASASSLPTLPGTSVTAASVRWIPSCFQRMVMASPVPAASAAGGAIPVAPTAVGASGSSMGGSSMGGSSSFDIQIELCLPDATLCQVAPLWQQIGLVPVTMPAREGGYWQPLDGLVHSYSLVRSMENMFLCLPALLRQWLGQQVTWLGAQGRRLLA